MSHRLWVRAPQGVMCLWILLLATAWTLRAWNCVGISPRGVFVPRRRLPPLQIAFVRERCAFNARRSDKIHLMGIEVDTHAHVRKEMQWIVSHMYVFHTKYIGLGIKSCCLLYGNWLFWNICKYYKTQPVLIQSIQPFLNHLRVSKLVGWGSECI